MIILYLKKISITLGTTKVEDNLIPHQCDCKVFRLDLIVNSHCKALIKVQLVPKIVTLEIAYIRECVTPVDHCPVD